MDKTHTCPIKNHHLSSILLRKTKNLTKDYDQSKKERKKIQCREKSTERFETLVVQTIVVIVGEGDNSCTCPRFSGDGGSLARDAGFEKA